MAKKRRRNPQEEPASARNLRYLYERGMADLRRRHGVSSVDELEMTPIARRMYELRRPGLR